MTTADAAASPFFLDTAAGRRFCIFHPPHGPCKGALLLVPPFGDEMNKARRMFALQARMLAARGIGVLQLDLAGSGDSDGDLADARWAAWTADVAAGAAWLAARLERPPVLLGLRLGGLLALDAARSLPGLRGIVLWQPVVSGDAFVSQLLRLKLASQMVAGGSGDAVAASRAALAAGEIVEIGGYAMTSGLTGDIAALGAEAMAPLSCPVRWFELAAGPDRPLAPATTRIAAHWRDRGAVVAVSVLACPPFWSTQEIQCCDALLGATCDAVADLAA